MSKLIPITTPLRKFKGHEESVKAVAMFPHKRRIVTGSVDKTLRLWDLKTGVMLKMDRHSIGVWRLAVSRDGQLIASGDKGGDVIIWHGEAGESLIQPIKAHPRMIYSLYFSPDGTVLTTGSSDKMMKLWDTKTWQQKENSIECGNAVRCERYSPPGTLLAIATFDNIEMYISGTKKLKCVASFKGHISTNLSLAWTPDGTRLLTGGNESDPTISEWDALT